jgi:hypothetical protein
MAPPGKLRSFRIAGDTKMSHSQFRTIDRSARATTAYWGDDVMNHQPRFTEVAMALLPASLILATATALLVAIV